MTISVITVCFNDRLGLQKTIESVLSQTYTDLEYIIVDGGSTDGTVELVQSYQTHHPIIFRSEPDQGIYDAMNKGLRLATGAWLNFMNAGDYFYAPTTLAEITPQLIDNYDIIYGRTEIRYADFTTIKTEPLPAKLWQGRIPHQSAFIRTATMKKYGYNASNKIAADLEFFLTVQLNGGQLQRVDQVVASFAKDGVTERLDQQVIKDAYQTVNRLQPSLKATIYYQLLTIKPLLKRLLPRSIFKLMRTTLNRFS
jgi:glycosyltransferase involved in cell wall biosynthesis